jgi:colicin import membrane protein
MQRLTSMWVAAVAVLAMSCKDEEAKPQASQPTPQAIDTAMSEADEAERAKRAAEAAARQAVADAAKARAELDALMRELDAFDAKVSKAVDAVADSQNDAERTAASAALKKLQLEQVELKQRIAAARAGAEKAERLKGAKISIQCIENPLAKGCQ